ncbi:POK25 protein, partial [Eurystomus gularis]|nr:POK25 protein [Eurystomus gularis]
LLEKTVKPQKVSIRTDVKRLNDVQKLLGTINWLRLLLGIATHKLKHLFESLKSDPDLTSP